MGIDKLSPEELEDQLEQYDEMMESEQEFEHLQEDLDNEEDLNLINNDLNEMEQKIISLRQHMHILRTNKIDERVRAESKMEIKHLIEQLYYGVEDSYMVPAEMEED
jgi:hypothetical protein